MINTNRNGKHANSMRRKCVDGGRVGIGISIIYAWPTEPKTKMLICVKMVILHIAYYQDIESTPEEIH